MSAEPHLVSNPPAFSPPTDAGLRRRARALAATAGSRLRLAACRAGGDAGLALLCALLDMIEEDVDPACWPVTDAIAMLRHEAERDRQVARLLIELREIEDQIASTDPDDEVVGGRPAA